MTDVQKKLQRAQCALLILGFDALGFDPNDPEGHLIADGDDGAYNKKAFSGYQEDRGLSVTGVLDDATWEALVGEDDLTTALVIDPKKVSLIQAQAMLFLLGHDDNGELVPDGDPGTHTVNAFKHYAVPEILACDRVTVWEE